MGLDFDAVEYCKNVKQQQSQPPYACPVPKCDRSYKTLVGLQYHLVKYDHDNPQPLTPILTPNRKKARSRGFHSKSKILKLGDDDQPGTSTAAKQVNPESLVTYNDEEQTVTFNLDGKSIRLGIHEPLPFIDDEEFTDLLARGCILNADAPPLEENAPWAKIQLPQAYFEKIEDYNVPDAPPRPLAYYRFIEKSAEELDGEIEYDVDEEDTAWLEWMNEEREKAGINPVNIDTMELLMDRLEKESYFQAAANGTVTGVEVDDDAVCCICMDGECQNTNVILFCDMCNLAVHQDCYGVPYIPEGQWLCRRCLQSPSMPVSCVLCPNTGGAFKQTDQGTWAHVVCALWIPEVRFANTVFLEPIDSIETIPAARWRLTCYVCKEKGTGACIQCQRNSCYAAFHVTCAQQAGLYMTMDTVKDGHNDSSVHVQKYAYCHAHTPPDAKLKTNQKEVEDTRHKMKEARKALAKKRSSAPVVLIPTIPQARVQEIASMVHMQKKSQFLDRLIAYWTLKRQYRNGVPLLRRLQSQGSHHGVIHRNGIEGSPDMAELYKQLKYWQCIRQDLERARLLCELVRKREKLKAAYVKICEQVWMQQLNPLESVLTKLLDALEARDTTEIFREPVNTEEVPDYLDIVKQPMDLGTMREKLKQGQYSTLEQMEADFDLMIQNCLAYNNKDTVFYRAGIRMRDQAAPLFQQVRKDLEKEGLADSNHAEHRDHVEMEIEEELKQLMAAPTCEETVQKMLILADKSQVLKNPTYRTKKIKQIRIEITRMRKAIKKARLMARNNSSLLNVHSLSEDEDDEVEASTENMEVHSVEKLKHHRERERQKEREQVMPKRIRRPTINANMVIDEDDTMGEESKETATTTQTPPCSPIKSLNNSVSPVGVNRRTAVLFTRKAQAALKRPSDQSTTNTPVKEESTPSESATAIASSNNIITGVSSNALAASLASSGLVLSNKLGSSHLTPLGATLGLNSTMLAGKSPKRNARHKRLSEMRNSSSMSPKKSPNNATSASVASSVMSTTGDLSFDRIPDSFRVYRANNDRDVSESDDDDLSDLSGSRCSSCSGYSVTGSGSDFDSSDDDDEDEENDGKEDTDEDDGEDEEEEDDDEEDDGTENADIDMQDVAGGNGEAMSCSGGESDSGSVSNAEAEEMPTNDDKDGRDEDSSAVKKNDVRTPTPSSEKRSRNASRAKQKIKNVATPVISAASMVPSPKIAATRAANKSTNTNANTHTSMSTRSTTPTNDIVVNNLKARKTSNSKAKVNNSHIAAASTPSPVPPPPNTIAESLKPPLEPLQLVWAKCRGYPWYPALILDPKTPKGFVYNGVPLPAPPPDVLALRKNYTEEEVFLVLFFDAKRTWQWLPANKLEILGIDKHVDQQKLVESRKPTDRKAVKKAYQDALHYQSQVSDLEGQGPDPIM